ncbi:MAG: hypothetical protein H7Y60_11105 [Rhodospirillaceae bacterium]|nr:hypothetical protein [Rhodospirillales bacterium]
MADTTQVVGTNDKGQHVVNIPRGDIARIDVVDIDFVVQTKSGARLIIPGAAMDAMSPTPPSIQFADGPFNSAQMLSAVQRVETPPTSIPAMSSLTQQELKKSEGNKNVHRDGPDGRKTEADAAAQEAQSQQVAPLPTGGADSSVDKLVAKAEQISEDISKKAFDPGTNKKFDEPAPNPAPPGEAPKTAKIPLLTMLSEGNVVDDGILANRSADLGNGGGKIFYGYAGPLNTGTASGILVGDAEQYGRETLTGTAFSDIILADGLKGLDGGHNNLQATYAALDKETGLAPSGTPFYYAKELTFNIAGYVRRLTSVTVTGLPDGVYLEGATVVDNVWTIPNSSVIPTVAFNIVYDVTKMRALFPADSDHVDINVSFNVKGVGTEILNITKTFVLRFQDVDSVTDITNNNPKYVTGAGKGWSDIFVMPTASAPHLINADDGNNVVYAGNSNDTINAGVGNDTIYAYAGNDTITAGDGANIIWGGNGDDTIYANTLVNTTTNTVTHVGTGDDIIYAGDGKNTVWSGDGKDIIYAGVTVNTVTNVVTTVGTGNNTITDSGGNNTIITGAGSDTVTTGAGNDVLTLGAGANIVTAGDGFNTVTTGDGDDIIYADALVDATNTVTHVGTGENLIYANDGKNSIWTGSGKDVIYAGVAVDAGTGTITSVGTGDNTIIDAGGANTITTGNGADRVTTGGGNDVLNLGDGANIVFAGAGTNFITAGSGKDVLVGGGDADSISAGAGNDTLYGGDGINTMLDGGADTDWLTFNGINSSLVTSTTTLQTWVDYTGGGISDDITLILTGATGAGTAVHGGKTDIVANIENFIGSSGNDRLDVQSYSGVEHTLYGLGGNDTLIGASGNDQLYGGAGNDSISGMAGNDTIDLGVADDGTLDPLTVIAPSLGFSTLTYPFTVNNWADGGAGADTLRGGAGRDYFVTKNGEYSDNDGNVDTFDGGDGIDVLDFSTFGVGLTITSSDAKISGSTPILIANYSNIEEFIGSTADDNITGGSSNDTLYGGTGNDTLNGAGGSNTLYGGSGTNTYNMGTGTDQVVGGANHDRIYYYSSNTAVVVNLDTSSHSFVNSLGATVTVAALTGGNRQEVLADASSWSNGDTYSSIEEIQTGNGSDVIWGDAGSTNFYLRNGNDVVYGLGGDDMLSMNGTGTKTFHGGTNNVVTVGSGGDTIDYNNISAAVTITLDTDGNSGNGYLGTATGYGTVTLIDVENVGGGHYGDTITGSDAANRIDGRGGGDDIDAGGGDDFILATSGSDVIDGGTGIDTVSYLAYNTTAGTNGLGVEVYLADADLSAYGINGRSSWTGFTTMESRYLSQTAGPEYDDLTNIENVIGTNTKDRLIGDSGANVLTGNNGDDTLVGNGGADSLYGGNDNDTFIVLNTSDVANIAILDGGAGTDTLYAKGWTFSGNDFSDNAKWVNIEAINVKDGGGGDAYGLRASDIRNVVDSGNSSRLTLRLDSGDTFTVDATGSTSTASAAITGGTRYSYYSGATLQAQVDVLTT